MENLSRTMTVAGLGTTTIIVPNTDTYTFDVTVTCPLHRAGTPSAVVVTINKNGSPIYASSAGTKGFHFSSQLAASNSITIVVSSISTADLGLNTIKTTIAISEGI